MPERVLCDLCDRPIDVQHSYVVRVDVFADPSMPPTTGEEIAGTDFDATIQSLLSQMQSMSADDLQDQVHRRFEYRLCQTCHRAFLANPLGKPRQRIAGIN